MSVLVSSEPAAKWVLLCSETSGLGGGQRATVVRFKDGSTPGSTSSGISSISTPSRFERGSEDPSPLSSNFMNMMSSGGSGQESGRTTPDSESSISTYLHKSFMDMWRSFLSNKPNESVRAGSRTPDSIICSPPSTSPGQAKHKKTKSWSHSTENVASQSVLPTTATTTSTTSGTRTAETPNLSAVLRVQPHCIRDIDWNLEEKDSTVDKSGSCNLGVLKWPFSRVFDAYVHPSTFPEVANYCYSSESLSSFLVEVKPLSNSTPSGQSESSSSNHTSSHPPGPVETAPLGGANESSSTSASAPSKSRLELMDLVHTIAELSSDSQLSDASDTSSVKSAKPPTLSLPPSLVLRLVFATKLVSQDMSRRMEPVDSLDESSPDTRYFREVSIAPGHVVLSSIVQQQLKVGVCSLLKVARVSEESKIPSTHYVSIHIHSLNERFPLVHEVTVSYSVLCNVCEGGGKQWGF